MRRFLAGVLIAVAKTMDPQVRESLSTLGVTRVAQWSGKLSG